MPERIIFILPGRNESIEELGGMIEGFGYGFQVREVAGEFEKLPFPAPGSDQWQQSGICIFDSEGFKQYSAFKQAEGLRPH